ncbi:MAG: MFS transporter, partial [Terriglobales bacterium]
MTETQEQEKPQFSPAGRGEILAWASYDIANSSYATVVATAVYNAYFVKVVAGNIVGRGPSFGTVLLTTMIMVSSIIIVLSAPVIGTICDATASKKRFLFITTFVCIFATAALYFVNPGDYLKGMILMIIATSAFGTGEDLIAAFLPELAHKNDMGRISSIGWAAGYVGGLFTLASCLAFISYEQHLGLKAPQFVPIT